MHSRNQTLKRVLFCSAIGVAVVGVPAFAQTVPASGQLEQIVVTATRQSDTVNRVPLSITADTEKALISQGINNIQDLTRITPGLSLSVQGSTTAGSNISLRGVASTYGTPTTGIYLDDVPLQRPFFQGNGAGAPVPDLFDLDRVEVLRGPQGTLYGGSTMGGALRFITPSPSLTTYSGQARAEASVTHDGAPSYLGAVAVGGPIVKDKLGFRISASNSREGGYIDHVSRFTGATVAENTNWKDHSMVRAALTWSPIEDLKITGSFYRAKVQQHDSDLFWEDIPSISAPAFSFTATGANCTPSATVTCARTLPAHVYPAYNMYGPYKSGDTTSLTGVEQPLLQQQKIRTDVFSLAVDYDLGAVDFKSITGYFGFHQHGTGATSMSGVQANLTNYPTNEIYTIPNSQSSLAVYTNTRQLSQEVRLTSNPRGQKLTWVAGLFYFDQDSKATRFDNSNLSDTIPVVQGVSYKTYFGYDMIPAGLVGGSSRGGAASDILEKDKAAFGEATYAFTGSLKATVGLRRTTSDYGRNSYLYGYQNVVTPGAAIPTFANGGLLVQRKSEAATTPKFNVSYTTDSGQLFYVTVSEGFRFGGFNGVTAQQGTSACQAYLAANGMTSVPNSYDADHLWSYEGGAKLRLMGGRAQINSSVFYIDWKNVQYQVNSPNCGTYVANAANAVSKGADIQGQVRFGDLTLDGTVGYDDSKYTADLYSAPGTNGVRVFLIAKGNRVAAVPAWQSKLGAQYDFRGSRFNPYIRVDFQFVGNSVRSTGPGTVSYTADIYHAPASEYFSARAGMTVKDVEVALFAKNLFNDQSRLFQVGGSTSTHVSPIVMSSTYRPREIGLQANYRW